MILAWIVYPLVLVALGAGWGVLIEKAAGARVNDALLVPLGLAGVLVVAGTITAFSAIAPAAVTVCAVGAVVGIALGRPWQRLGRWPYLAAVGVVLAYGAPVLLSGHANFLGYLRLDDSATWFGVVDNVMSHGRSVAGLPQSTYTLVYSSDVGPAYPLGAFMVLGVSRALSGVDVAWVFQPYLACCGAAIALCVYALAEPLVASPRKRALVAFLAAQPALLYGYSLWGGIKELTAAFLLVLGMALAAVVVAQRPGRGRELLGLAISAGALIATLTVGAAAWIAPAFAIVAAVWLWRAWAERLRPVWRGPLISSAWLAGLTAACAVPFWVVLRAFLSNDSGLFSAGQTTATRIGNLIQPLSAYQLAGIWPIGDFRLTAPTFPTALLIGLALAAVAVTLVVTARRGQFNLLLYVAVALAGCAVFGLSGATPWVTGKALAISSPAVLTVALVGAAMLWNGSRLGVVVLAILGAGVIWSNVLGYHDAVLAPRDRLAELQHIGGLVSGKGPTFINDFEVYADRHFLRDGAPVEPAEYRYAQLPLSNGVLLVKTGYADLDSFPLSTLVPYTSIVIRHSPVESRPPSIYKLVWEGRYYELWQRPATAPAGIITHVPLGDQRALPYCGAAENGANLPLCSIAPAAVPKCAEVMRLARVATRQGGQLVAYQRPPPIVVRGDDVLWPGSWIHDPNGHSLTANVPGTAVAHIALAASQSYELWLGGLFTRGFDVSVDGNPVGRVKDEISDINGYVPIAKLTLTAGVHTIALTYPHADLTPGSGDNQFTSLTAIAFEPLQSPPAELLTVAPRNASTLCGRPLDWIEVVAPAR
jgi:hypothetical protein